MSAHTLSLALDPPHTHKHLIYQEFSHLGEDVRSIVTIASVVMAVVLIVICLFTIAFAMVVSNGIVKPVNQLIDVVHSLYTMDFSKHVRWSTALDSLALTSEKTLVAQRPCQVKQLF